MSEILEKEIADLQLFADPFDGFEPELQADGWTATFVRKGEEISIRREPDGTIRTLAGPGQPIYRNFKGLLVSKPFADLPRLARNLLYRTTNLIDPNTGNLKEFLPVAGEIQRSNGDRAPLSFEYVRDMPEQPDNRLCVQVIDGSAGVGKTHLLERIVRSRAAPASYKSGKPLLLHIESRGKVLTSLNDRIAGTLSALRASFFEEELKPLIRRGAIQLAIDGFDEFSDSRGYVRAWGTLRDFIRDLEGKGACMLAGRDTMLDRVTVGEGLRNAVDDNDIVFLRVQPPPADKIRVWLSHHEKWRDRRTELNFLERQIESGEYLRRPFFISRIADLGPDRFQGAQGEPIADLMESIIQREGEKLTGVSSDISAGLASNLYGEVLSEVARIMMDDETNEIETDLVELVLEEAFTGQANPEMVSALVQRARALSLLEEERGGGNKRTFPHETVRSYFFARSVFDYFPRHGATTGLHRVPLTADDFRIFNRVARRKSEGDQGRLRKELLKKLREPGGYDYLRSNIGGLLLSFAPLEEDESGDNALTLSHLELRDVWLADLLGTQKVILNGCHVQRLDVRGADLRGVQFSNTEIVELLADPFVRFGTSAPDVNCIIVYKHFKEQDRLFNGISEWITQRSQVSGTDDADIDEKWPLLEKFARVSMRQYWIRSVDDQMDHASRKIIASPLWPELRNLLEKYNRLDVSTRAPASGPKSVWFHLVAGEELLNPVPESRNSTRLILEELNVHLPWRVDRQAKSELLHSNRTNADPGYRPSAAGRTRRDTSRGFRNAGFPWWWR